MTTTRIRPCGEAALMLDCADLSAAVELARRVEQQCPEAVDVVAGARTVLVAARDASELPELRRELEELLARDAREAQVERPFTRHHDAGVREVILDVRYDGPDLSEVADLAGLSTDALIRRHQSITWRAAFGGFAPGFFYLVDERDLTGDADVSEDLHGATGANGGRGPAGGGPSPAGAQPPARLPVVPRLGSPRPRVPAGSVGLADRFCAVYPGASPGGWRLIGATDALLWDPDRPDPALLAPGDRVRFRSVHPRDGSR
ncbi:allophanate hydrolase [Dietzia natronolimnaea]|uniref:Allophanate hydrolase n=1 Tax=Dietzia natronolimnaea TaxID=161920 RepID=A0A2A2WSX9_9ACTN|nr:carboxyltransferase domain-containing protein [Dietzia natronolimnaea]PAY24143.1 allophanate hydrolase [Dietzia natronolimnaea]